MPQTVDADDPFLIRPDRRKRVPIDAPPPTGPRFDGGPPTVSVPQETPRSPDPDRFWENDLQVRDRFVRMWGTTFRRWLLILVGFLAVSALAAAILGVAYPSRDPLIGDAPGPYYFGAFVGTALVYLVLIGWWLDHILAGTGRIASLVIQALASGAFGLMGGSGGGGTGDPTITFPGFYFGVVGALGVALGHLFAHRVQGSFDTGGIEAHPSSAR